jgi:Ino eighty subunit 2
MLADAEDGDDDDRRHEKASPLFVRYRQTVQGTTLAIPEEWLESPAGSVFSGAVAKPIAKPWGGRMVEEVS